MFLEDFSKVREFPPPLRPRALSAPRCALNVLPEETRFFLFFSPDVTIVWTAVRSLSVGLLTLIWLFGRFVLVS